MPSLRKMRSEGPPGGAGLIRYFDVDEGGPKMEPTFVVGVVGVLIVLELMIGVLL